jgi:hypothetical protein
MTCRAAVRTEPVSAVQNQSERVSCSPSGYYHVYYGDVCECGRREWWEAERAATLRELVRARGRA